ncbi:MAG: hypothetical protein ABI813_13150 [Bacteroidota bacterium]
MSIQIDVQDSHAQLLIDFYISRIRVLREEIMIREQETREINSVIQKLKKKSNLEKSERLIPITNYSEKWPWVKKVQYAIEYQNRPLTTKEIVDVLSEFESSLLIDRKRAVASISSILSSKSGEDKDFLRVESDSRDFAYVINSHKEIEITPHTEIEDEDRLPF